MKLTTRGRYAVTAMLDIALHESERPSSLPEIAERQGLSLSYLEQLFLRLRRNGLVAGRRGPGGGYRLAQPAAAITVEAIIAAVDRPVDVTVCGGNGNCQGGSTCLTHHLWDYLGTRIRSLLAEISLDDLVHRREVLEVAKRQDQASPSMPLDICDDRVDSSSLSV